uniref:F-box/LRR-repeat protein 15/At3g58940/PEG3-like LRR domain-containing protein n=1 Tax=Arundo donax TaxID=35708 RepID=A0A0A9HBM9_ARUDO
MPLDIAKLQVRSQSLRSLTLDICELAEVVVVDAPNLERLLGGVKYGNVHCKVTLVNTPKLEIIGFLTVNLTLMDSVRPWQVIFQPFPRSGCLISSVLVNSSTLVSFFRPCFYVCWPQACR